jgi:hypothetical protein
MQRPLSGNLRPVLILALATLLAHLLVNGSGAYGFFRDEFYYIACSEHLAPGYVDHPPLSILLLKLSRLLLGDSLVAIRFLPALARAVTVFLTGWMTREMGGGRAAQVMAALCVMIAPVHLGIGNFYSMNVFEILVWTAAAALLIRLIREPSLRLWLGLGLLLGLGLQNKISVIWLGAGLTLGLLITPLRSSLRTRGPWLAAAIAFLLFLPHILWQVAHGWPTLEFMRVATQEKMAAISPMEFLTGQILAMHPVVFPIWLCGLIYLMVTREGERFRLLGVIYLAVVALLIVSGRSRGGYLAPAYPMLLAAGGIVLEKAARLSALRLWFKEAVIVLLVVGGLVTAPLALPVLPVESYIAYAAFLGFAPSTEENKDVAALPQFYADMHGWEAMVGTVADVYREAISREGEPAAPGDWAVLTPNYGSAGAIDFLGRDLGAPPAISGHNNYWFWGPGDPPPRNLIILGGRLEDHGECGTVRQAAIIDCGLCMPYENNRPVFVCKDLKISLGEIWPHERHFD